MNTIDEVRHSVLMEYWSRVGSIECDEGLYTISVSGSSHDRLTIDAAMLLLKLSVSKRLAQTTSEAESSLC